MKITSLVAFSFRGSFKNTLDYILSDLSFIGEPESVHKFDFPRRNIFTTPLFFSKIILSCLRSNNTTLLVPRGNSRLILWLLKFSIYKNFISYSDGLGDCIDDFILNNHPKYLGHIGFREITNHQNLLVAIPLENAIESWHELVRYSPDAPILIIIKIPKQIDCPLSFVLNFYARIINTITNNNSKFAYISCSTSLGNKFTNKRLVNIGSLNQLNEIIYVSSVIGLPSTIFLSFSKTFPSDSIRIITLPSKRTYPKANLRTKIMSKLAIECRKHLYPK